MIEHGAIRRRGYKATSAAILALTTTLAGAAVMPASATASPAQASASHAAPASAHQGYSAPISGTTTDGRSVSGTFTPQKFHVQDGKLVVRGMLRGTIEGRGAFQRNVAMQVQNADVAGAASGGRFAGAAAGACDILNLDLGPLDLNLLGLQVHLNEVVLDITAVPGAGNLLGNLLCQVAGLLDQGGGLGNLLNNLLGQLSGLLNQILGALGTV